MQISISSNAPQVGRFLGRVATKQLPFATSKAINLSASAIKKAEQRDIHKHFNIRTKWLTKSGAMPLKASSKRQYPNIYATLRVKDEVAALAATGGDHSARNGLMAVPFSDAGGGQSTREILNPTRRTLPRSKWPSKIIGKGNGKRSKGNRRKVPKPFMLKSKATGHHYVVKRASKTDSSLRFLYGFRKRTKIEKQWPLVENARARHERNFPRHFRVEFRKAIRSAK
ncbi:MAG: hypothetical protein JKY93_01075 [Gammaproteobacteria bacterium]|nr:hypothetical protein [Gammaproteobacteria bacterium]